MLLLHIDLFFQALNLDRQSLNLDVFSLDLGLCSTDHLFQNFNFLFERTCLLRQLNVVLLVSLCFLGLAQLLGHVFKTDFKLFDQQVFRNQ